MRGRSAQPRPRHRSDRQTGTIDVGTAVRLATEWVEHYAAENPGFRGAHLMGGIIDLATGAPFPPTSDVDLGILLAEPAAPGREVIDVPYAGLAIEAGLRSVEQYRSPEIVLANPELASNLATDSIIADPGGLLTALQPAVAAGYGRRRWVVARCEVEKRQALAALERAATSGHPLQFLLEALYVLLYLSGLIAVASLRQPTHRKCLIRLHGLLAEEGHSDLYEATLTTFGLAGLSPSQVARYLEQMTAAFERAVTVWKTPCPFDFKLRRHLRPYLIDGTRAMLDEGNHREAVPWICFLLYASTSAIYNDAPTTEHGPYQEVWTELFIELGIADPAAWPDRIRAITGLTDSFFMLADEIAAQRPGGIPQASSAP